MKELSAREKSYIYERVADITEQLEKEISDITVELADVANKHDEREAEDPENYNADSWEYRYNVDNIDRMEKRRHALREIIDYLNKMA